LRGLCWKTLKVSNARAARDKAEAREHAKAAARAAELGADGRGESGRRRPARVVSECAKQRSAA
jgi:hypothetical protein